jgi:purine-binding chemotaxis protein CheW
MTTIATTSRDATTPGSQQVLTFVLGSETYGVDILRVQEIRGWSSVTKIPHAPPHVLGVLNLRGSIVPIVDMRMQFNLERAEYTAVTVIIVLSVQSRAATEHIRGLMPVADRMVVLLDIDRLIGGQLPGTSMEQQEPSQAAAAA